MDEFEVPAIPKIFVPQNIINTSESQSHSNSSKSVSKPSNREDLVQKNETNSLKSETTSNTEDTKKDGSSAPQLCASCSQILLSYFMPLQQYVNDVVEMARGDRVVTSRPLINLLNTEVLKSKIENSSSEHRNEGNNYETDSNKRYDREVSQLSTESKDNRKTIHNSTNESNLNRHQNQNYSQKQNFNQTESYNQNLNQSSAQTYVSSNVSQRADQSPVQSTETVNWEQSVESPEQKLRNSDQESSDLKSRVQTVCGDKSYETVYQQNSDSYTTEEAVQTSSEQATFESKSTLQPENAGNESNESNGSNGSAVNENKSSMAMAMGMAISSPHAFVTIAYNNLSATNAIILANSLLLTNNRSMNIMDRNGNKSIVQIPFIILIGGNIDPVLKDAIYIIFDEVISQPMDVKVALLSDQSFGIQQFKLQLWKELQNYQKCLYLESSTLVVGRITNLFEECYELSACVDWLYPDNFNCSVFVFEPSLTTYEEIISFAIFHQKCSAQKDEGVGETLDEMTLLNQFFAPKWNRISFVYNFVKNEAIYTQMPAFMKYGDSIRIVNFGHMMSQTGILGNQPGMSSVQPWHILFDLLACSQQDVIKAMSIDNYSKFYLNCFIQRLWPILQNHLTPLLISKYGVGRREWSIFDLIRLLTNESGIETDDHMFTQTPITFRRIKSSAEKMSKYETLSIEDEDDYLTEQMPILAIDDFESQSDYQKNFNREEAEVKTKELEKAQYSAPQLTPQQQDERSKREWEAGRIDWMGAHQSDRIINRLKKLIRND